MQIVNVEIRHPSYSIKPEVTDKASLIARFESAIQTIEIRNAIEAQKYLESHPDLRMWTRKVKWGLGSYLNARAQVRWRLRTVSYYTLDEMMGFMDAPCSNQCQWIDSMPVSKLASWIRFHGEYSRIRYEWSSQIQEIRSLVKLLERNTSPEIQLVIDKTLWFLVTVTLDGAPNPKTISG